MRILKFRKGYSASWQEMTLTDEFYLGRGADCNLTLADSSISRRHAMLISRGNQTYLLDLHSANGTFLNGKKIESNQPILITPDQIFTIGEYQFQVFQPNRQFSAPDANLSRQSPVQGNKVWFRFGKGNWQQINFSGSITIGRSEDCDLQLDDTHLSRRHLRIESVNDAIYLTDLGSSNGTFLEGKRLPPNQRTQLSTGHYFSVGDIILMVTALETAKGAPSSNSISSEGYLSVRQQPPPTKQPEIVRIKKEKRNALPIILGAGAVLLICLCAAVVGGYMLFSSPKPTPTAIAYDLLTETPLPPTIDPIQPEELTNTPSPVLTDSPSPTQAPPVGDRWLILYYADADDEILEQDIFVDVNEAEYIGSSDKVTIVNQLDRYNGAYEGDGDWAGTRRYHLFQDDYIDEIGTEPLSDLGEVNMGDVNSLVDFALWAINEYPADHYVLIMSDHGSGWFGGFSDGDNADDGIFIYELDQALGYIRQQTGIDRFDLIGFDACLMAQLEVSTMVAQHAGIVVSAEETEPAMGWAYAGFLNDLINRPEMQPRELAESIVNAYIYEDLIFEFIEESPDNYIVDTTLSALDLSKLPALNQTVNEFARAMTTIDQSIVAAARTYAQSYTSIFTDMPPSSLDLVHFAQVLCTESGSQEICSLSDEIRFSVQDTVIAEVHGADRPGSNGISFYFPNSEMFTYTYDDGYQLAYRRHAEPFTNLSLWDEFLDFHYLGKEMP